MIPKETEAEILRLYHAEKWRVGTIAEQLGLHHATVQRVLRQTRVEPKALAPRPSMTDPFESAVRDGQGARLLQSSGFDEGNDLALLSAQVGRSSD
jgi:IS30 family transposase